MTDEQRSLAGYKSKVHEQGDFENPNDGKPFLNDTDEYVLQLKEFPRVKTFDQVKEKKDGSRTTIKVDKAICNFEEKQTKNIVTAFFRVDTLNFSEEEAYESAVVRFFKKIKQPLPENAEPDWTKYFIVGMRFRARVVIGKGQDKQPNHTYFLDVPTCRPLLPSDKAGEDFAHEAPQKPDASDGTLANALLLAKGAVDFNSAMAMLKDAGASKEVVMALFQANLDNKVIFPI